MDNLTNTFSSKLTAENDEIDKLILGIVNNIINCYKEVEINRQMEETERIRIREQALVCISFIENNTEKFKIAVEATKNTREGLLNAIVYLITVRDLDEVTIRLCDKLLTNLSKYNPLDNLDFNVDLFNNKIDEKFKKN